MGLWNNNINPIAMGKQVLSGINKIVKNTNITSVLMTAATVYFNQKQKVSWYFSPATNYEESGVSLKGTNLTSTSVLPMAYFIDVNVSHGGQTVGAPIEEGSFNVYNKTTEPISMDVTLAFDENKGSYLSVEWAGLKTEVTTKKRSMSIAEVINRLITLKKYPITFNIITPVHEYQYMTLESCDYAFTRENGMGVLFVNCKFKEIPQVPVITYTPQQVASSGAASVQKTGTVAAKTPTSVAADACKKGGLWDTCKSYWNKFFG